MICRNQSKSVHRFLCLVSLILNTFAFAKTGPTTDTAKLNSISQLNVQSSCEPASAHDPSRLYLSAGVSQLQLETKTAFTEKEGESFPLWQQKLGLTKSFFYPLSLHLAYGRLVGLKDQEPYQLSSYLQWTVYESFAMPALSLRGQWGRIYEMGKSDVQSFAISGQTSWGYRWLTIFGGASFNYHRLRFAENEQTFPEQPYLELEPSNSAFGHPSFNAGLQWQLIPGFLALATEWLTAHHSRQMHGSLRLEF